VTRHDKEPHRAGVEGEYATKLGKLFDLTGRVAFITGAGRGVGAHIAHGMARFGAKVSAPPAARQAPVPLPPAAVLTCSRAATAV
jgi:hypothetical protein